MADRLYRASMCTDTRPGAAQAASGEGAKPLRLMIKAEKFSYRASEIPTTQDPRSQEAVISVTGEIQNIGQQAPWVYVVESTVPPSYNLTDPAGKPVEIASRIADPPLPRREDFILIKAEQSWPRRFDAHF